MTNTTNDRPVPRKGSPFRAAPLPEGPGEAGSFGDRASLVRAQSDALGVLIREDLSRSRMAVFLLGAVVLTGVAALAPVVIVDTATAGGNDATDVAVAAVLACVLLAVLGAPALLVLRALRSRGRQRSRLMREWAAVDRGYDSEFPSAYGSRGYPHSRFFGAALILSLVLILTVAVLADLSDPSVLAMLPGLLVAGLLAWTAIRKYADRYGWASREQVIRGRERRRQRHRGQLITPAAAQVSGAHPAVLCIAFVAPLAIVVLLFAVIRPKNALGLAVAGLLALALLAVGVPKVLLRRRRERAALAETVRPLMDAAASGANMYPIRYGLDEPIHQEAATGHAAWDRGPTRMGVLGLEGDTLRLSGVDGGAVQLPHAELLGVAFLANTVAWLDPSVDLLLHTGEAIEVRSTDAEAIADTLAAAGVPMVSA
ncbi:hypothetical protein [Streptomyces phaeochromogenes]|uniref:hypothetical protein n=1 Tax=Streptomyces phaeochromogenes TaxID=1923 RepID=UPI002DDBB0CB|nr:hypothetical protein [Streptomyces phaeochromogenes]WRZ31922.1 hypothetical protein OG931_31395 [Streptomyces phaeochromogenes]